MYSVFFILIPVIVGLWAQHKVGFTYHKFSRVLSNSGVSGCEAAEHVLWNAGVRDVEIFVTPGHLTDHYDANRKQLFLSEENYYGTSLAALGMAAHEAGHVIQHAAGYSAIRLRQLLIPLTNIASALLPLILILGALMGYYAIVHFVVFVYLILTFLQFVTLPIEFDASRRAGRQLLRLGIVNGREVPGFRKTLNAAGFTYLAAFVASLGNFAYLFRKILGKS